jgi:hypothetical protein
MCFDFRYTGTRTANGRAKLMLTTVFLGGVVLVLAVLLALSGLILVQRQVPLELR